MIIHKLSVAECREILAGTNVGRLACVRLDQPYIVPVFFYFDREEDHLYSFATLGQKIDWMRTNPKVCVEVENIVDQFHWATVVVFGRYDEIGGSAPESDARRRAFELFQGRPEWWLPGTGKLASGKEHHTPVFYRIWIDEMTGRRAARPEKASTVR
jgi:nitroimidazol reductase NimA-like FMN-containing flavoprotein (pyridoxamine 5'-phosphate oxidase superfamily)